MYKEFAKKLLYNSSKLAEACNKQLVVIEEFENYYKHHYASRIGILVKNPYLERSMAWEAWQKWKVDCGAKNEELEAYRCIFEQDRQPYETLAIYTANLIRYAEENHLVVTIETVPLQPLKMGNYKMQAAIRAARGYY